MKLNRKRVSNKNPLLANGHTHGQSSEKRVMKDIGARQTIASGAIPGMKSDGTTDQFQIESKATVKNSISLKHEWLKKIRKEALDNNRTPALTISFVNADGKEKRPGDWVLIPKNVFAEFVAFMENDDELF